MMFRDRPRVHRHDDECGHRTLPLDPDPIRPPGTDELFPGAEYVAGYDAGFDDAERLQPPRSLVQATAFGLGIVIGMVIATVLMSAAAATPRSAETTVPVDVSGVLSARLTGAPHAPGCDTRSQVSPRSWNGFGPQQRDRATGRDRQARCAPGPDRPARGAPLP